MQGMRNIGTADSSLTARSGQTHGSHVTYSSAGHAHAPAAEGSIASSTVSVPVAGGGSNHRLASVTGPVAPGAALPRLPLGMVAGKEAGATEQ